MGEFKKIWMYRGFVLGSVKREFQSKYRNSLLGAAWPVLNPLAMIIVYTVIFSQVMRAKLPGIENNFAYSIYLCAGVLTWGLFAEIVSRSQNIFLENSNLLKKISFPRLCLPLIVIISASINFSIIFCLFLLFLIVIGNFPGVLLLLGAISLLVILLLFSIGLGITLGVLNVFFRDVGHFFNVFLQFWFWLTPIVYPKNILPDNIRGILELNPIVPIVSGLQEIFISGNFPQWNNLAYPTILALSLCMLGFKLFRKYASDIVDEI